MNKEWSELNKSMQAQIKKKDTWQDGVDTLISLSNQLIIQWLQSGDLEIPGGIRILSTDCNCQEVKFQLNWLREA